MKTLIALLGICSISSTVSAQSLTNKPIFETNSIKVVTNEKFPQDLESEIFVGPKGTPYFHVEGTQEKIKSLQIDLGKEPFETMPSISVFPKEGETNSYILFLFSTDADGKIFALFDLNCDGVWDVKRTPTREQKNFIFLDSHWVAVTKIEGIKSANPTAEGESIRYEFQNGWKIIR